MNMPHLACDIVSTPDLTAEKRRIFTIVGVRHIGEGDLLKSGTQVEM